METSACSPCILPPPSVTSALHIGHGLTAADTIVRWRRMSGVTSYDNKILAVVVEKKLIRENNVTRHDIGRERFVSESVDILCFLPCV
ncbi:unnamed protein product [Musa hybrid cultivar]